MVRKNTYSCSTCFCWWRRGGHRDGCLRIHGGGGRGLLRWDGGRLPRHKASLALKKIDLDFKCCRFIFREIQPQLWLAERNTSTNQSRPCILQKREHSKLNSYETKPKFWHIKVRSRHFTWGQRLIMFFLLWYKQWDIKSAGPCLTCVDRLLWLGCSPPGYKPFDAAPHVILCYTTKS